MSIWHHFLHLVEWIFIAGAFCGIILDEIISAIVRRIRKRRNV